jgi:hypothetical protein
MSKRNAHRAYLPILALLVVAAVGCSEMQPKVMLFDGASVDGWKCVHPNNCAWQTASAVKPDRADPRKFVITPGEGLLVNGPTGKTSNLVSVAKQGDCQAHIEFMVPTGSNSGVYFQGRYEVQILDSFGKDKVGFGDCGGIYARWVHKQSVEGHAPRVNASKPPGEWQTFDVVFRAPRFDTAGKKIANAKFVKVVFNGKVVQENVELTGPTRSPLVETDVATGPLMLQGDHGPVAYRNIWIRPMK